MKRILYIILVFASLVVSCQHEDIWNELRDHEERIQKLETLCNKLNSNIEAMQAVLTALEQNDYVTDVVKVVENGIGQTVRHEKVILGHIAAEVY